MTLGKIVWILIFSSLAATGAALARDISKNRANSKNLANSKQVANVKGDKCLRLGRQPPWWSTRLARSADRRGAQHQFASQNQAASREK